MFAGSFNRKKESDWNNLLLLFTCSVHHLKFNTLSEAFSGGNEVCLHPLTMQPEQDAGFSAMIMITSPCYWGTWTVGGIYLLTQPLTQISQEICVTLEAGFRDKCDRPEIS